MKPARSRKKFERPYTWAQLHNGDWLRESIQ
ncbi:SAM-dependent methyltransferase, partial [Vibrio breoganii]